MRIGMLLDKPFPPDPRVANEARSLVAAGHEVHLLCLRFEAETPAREIWHGIEVHRRLIDPFFYRKASALALVLPAYFQFFARVLRAFLSETRVEALHGHDLPLLSVGLQEADRRGLPVVSDLHENWPAAIANYDYARRFPGNLLISPERWRAYERKHLPRAARVIVVVDESAERLPAYGIPRDRIAVVSNTVQVDEFEGFPRDAEIEGRGRAGFTVAYLGGFDRHRGLETAVRALGQLRDWAELRLLLVGDGATRGALEREVHRHGLGDRVEFAGWQPFRLFPSFVAGASVALIPHLKSEHTDTTIPHKLFHYMLLERAVVSTDCLPLARIIESTGAGRIYASGDPVALASRLRELRDPLLRAELGAKGRSAVLERYRWDLTARTLVDLYRDLHAERGAAEQRGDGR